MTGSSPRPAMQPNAADELFAPSQAGPFTPLPAPQCGAQLAVADLTGERRIRPVEPEHAHLLNNAVAHACGSSVRQALTYGSIRTPCSVGVSHANALIPATASAGNTRGRPGRPDPPSRPASRDRTVSATATRHRHTHRRDQRSRYCATQRRSTTRSWPAPPPPVRQSSTGLPAAHHLTNELPAWISCLQLDDHRRRARCTGRRPSRPIQLPHEASLGCNRLALDRIDPHVHLLGEPRGGDVRLTLRRGVHGRCSESRTGSLSPPRKREPSCRGTRTALGEGELSRPARRSSSRRRR